MIIARSKSNCNPLFSFFWGGRCNATLGGERSILLSYRDIYSIFGLFPGFLELQPVLRRLRRAVLLIKKRSIFDLFFSSFRIIDPSAIVRREVGTVASGVISQDDLNSQQNYCFSADSCSPFFLGGVCSIQLSYWDIYKFYAIFKARRNRTICRLGGGRSIQLSYGGVCNWYCTPSGGVCQRGDGKKVGESVGLSNILDSDLSGSPPAERPHG